MCHPTFRCFNDREHHLKGKRQLMPATSPADITTADFICPPCITAHRAKESVDATHATTLTGDQMATFRHKLLTSRIPNFSQDSISRTWLERGHIPGAYKATDPIYSSSTLLPFLTQIM